MHYACYTVILQPQTGLWARVWPKAIGRKAAGTVSDVGPAVTNLGRVTISCSSIPPQCSTCVRCRNSEAWMSDIGVAANNLGALLNGGTHLMFDGEPIHHHMGVAAFAEYTLLLPGPPRRNYRYFRSGLHRRHRSRQNRRSGPASCNTPTSGPKSRDKTGDRWSAVVTDRQGYAGRLSQPGQVVGGDSAAQGQR